MGKNRQQSDKAPYNDSERATADRDGNQEMGKVSDQRSSSQRSKDGKIRNRLRKFCWTVVLLLTVALLATRLVLHALFTVVFIDCLGNNASTTPRCLNFDLIPNRFVFEPLLPLVSATTTITWLVVLQQLQTKEPSYSHIGRKLLKKLYFWKYVVVVVIVCVYHTMVAINNIGLPGSYYYFFAPFEEICTATLMLISNFRTGPTHQDDKKFKHIRKMFKGVLLVTAIENVVLFMVTSVYLSLHILTLPSNLTRSTTIHLAINLTLLAVNAKYRWILADFFLAKTFLKDKNCRILRDVGDNDEACVDDNDEGIHHV
ncbi:uncharacterized protein [Ptychodera flava]|uniref:uncharacterized protein n=1 Tax=Ptychodera flava TaxID=63121 RepID=UPI00396A799E